MYKINIEMNALLEKTAFTFDLRGLLSVIRKQ